MDREGKIHGIFLNGKELLSCEQNGEGSCKGEMPKDWFKIRDELDTITAIEVPHIAETGHNNTDLPRFPLIRNDSMKREWGGR